MEINIGERVSQKIFSIESDRTVLDLAHQMTEKKVGSLLVTRDGKYIGIATEVDIVRKVVNKELHPKETSVSSIMSAPLITIEANASFMEANDKMEENNIRHLVVTKEGTIVGVLATRDLLHPIYVEA